RLLVLLVLLLAVLSLMGMVAVQKSRSYNIRGIPRALPEPIVEGGARLGINTALEQYDASELNAVLDNLEEVGIDYVKQSFTFCGAPDWETSDAIISAVQQHDLTLIPLLDGCPTDDYKPPQEQQPFISWIGDFAERYGDSIEYYIIWDEPNLASHWGNSDVNPNEYAALFTAAAKAIRNTDATSFLVLAPLAPTTETGPQNIADSLYLEALYDAGIAEYFDIVAGKPYGFDTGPEDRAVDQNVLNFSRIILLREVMERYGDGNKAIWAGNWGWNSLPQDWEGKPSIWGQVDEITQEKWTTEAFMRVKQEWPWMGIMFLENYEPDAPLDDPRWGFSIADRPILKAIAENMPSETVSYPGFTWAEENGPSQSYKGEWRFSPEFGVDVGRDGDTAAFRFWGTDVGLNIRRADYHARFYVTVDGESANLLPDDGNGSALVLNAAVPGEDSVTLEPVSSGLEPGEHLLALDSFRGSDQWALKGFTAGYVPPDQSYRLLMVVLGAAAIGLIAAAVLVARRVHWSERFSSASRWMSELNQRQQLILASVSALIVAAGGWLTWGEQAAGIYRRLGDTSQLALTAAMASIFYITPSFIVYAIALTVLFVIILLRPAWGVALVAFSIPFYVKPKPMLGYRFSPVEFFLLITFAAFIISSLLRRWMSRNSGVVKSLKTQLINADYAVIVFAVVAIVSLLFTERLDVATNELRVVIIEPVLLYLMLRAMRLQDSEIWVIIDAFILGGVVIAAIGLYQYATGQNLITAEGGLMRLRSVFGSPNNVALYLGRMIPLMVAMMLMGTGRRRTLYTAALLPIGIAVLLTYSKGSLLLGLPASLLVVLILWRRSVGGRIWPWLLGVGALGAAALVAAMSIPQISGRLNPQGETGFFRLNLWESSINMIKDHPLFGVGLDNFLYAYRGRYILDSAWREPNLNHPHNIILDFATRLGLIGLAAGIWLIIAFLRIAIRLQAIVEDIWRPVAVGILGFLTYMIMHGLVDHSFFLVDLAYAFFLMLGVAVWLEGRPANSENSAT
ncbi:MAG: O-antigen ligase family protein, partial [Candidatus Promineifilaceae bacterium]